MRSTRGIPSFTLLKSSGDLERFSLKKLKRSLRRAGASQQTVRHVIRQILPQIKSGVTTSQIWQLAYRLLSVEQKGAASRYSLKRALFALGPSGFPFEKFMAKILEAHGYSCQTNLVLNGKCVEHEIDILGRRDGVTHWIECKFHHEFGIRSDLKTALYCQARHLDLQGGRSKNSSGPTQFWLMTNTQFSSEAIRYAACSGLKLMGWGYPAENSIQTLIESAGLYPITCLGTLRPRERAALFEKGIATVQQIQESPRSLAAAGVSPARVERLLQETSELLNGRD